MSINYIRLHYGPIKTLDGIVHRPQKIRGLQDYLQKNSFRVDTIRVHIFEYCMIELCGRNVFQCKVSNFGFNTHWSRDALCQTAMKVILEARINFMRVCVYQWLHSMIEESFLNHSKFAPKEYCIDDISDISSRDSTMTTATDYNVQLEMNKKDQTNLSPQHYVTSIRKSITIKNNFKDSRERRVTEMSVFNNLLNQRIRSLSNNMYDKYSRLELNSRESTLATLVEQSSPNPTSSHVLHSSFLETILTTNETNNDGVMIRVSNDSTKNYSTENESLEASRPSRRSENDGHFLAVHSALSLYARNSMEGSTNYINECPSQLFMQQFIAHTFQKKIPTEVTDNNNSKDDSMVEENTILKIPKSIGFGLNAFDSLKESNEETETGSLNSRDRRLESCL
ncbi:uncharacterized protein LOC113239452 isoform X1 [Hyposmocoma kahamanoa]|uniref:uncharacterized protein LOC113239452 isoform X1 n=1 Tax=Hyposmocoma kahamanoa TaxID=1477025 RepID=UPI000E6D92D8|nr:uncharacterized protein LOC113239452 isoform X1 [Hyposmocoma kahamanoa]